MWSILGPLQWKCNMEVKKETKLEVTTLNSLILRGLQMYLSRGSSGCHLVANSVHNGY